MKINKFFQILSNSREEEIMTAYFKKARTCTVVVLIAVLLCSICFMPEQAEAATKYQLVKQEYSDVRVQAAGGYYWFNWDYFGDDNGLNLYYLSLIHI